MPTEEQYWEVLRERVCAKCVDGDASGGCRIASDYECALKRYLPQIIAVVNSTQSDSIEPYEAQLRNKVCGMCIHQSSTGICSLRDHVDCALDRYYPLIVEVIEELKLKENLGRI